MKKLSLITVAVAVFIVGTIASCEKKPKPTDPTENPTENPTGGTEDGIFVSKKQETSNYLVETFTGVNCSSCPSAHRMEDQLANVFPEKFYVINIQSPGSMGNAAPPDDLRTNFSSPLWSFALKKLNQGSVPSAMINRLEPPVNLQYPEGTLLVHHTDWSQFITDIIANKPTYVNVAAKTTINSADRTLSCHVQVYYTEDAPIATNNIIVAVLQNELIAKQAGDKKYPHMSVLRHLVTGQWGEAIESDMKKGSLYEKTFTWTIPTDMRTIPIPLENVEILVFISEGKQAPVVKVCKSSIEIK